MAFAPQNCYLVREMVVASKKQAAYGTPSLDADLVQRLLFDPGAFVDMGSDVFNDAGLAGKANYFSTFEQQTALMTALKMKGQVDDFLAGWLAANAMWSLVDTGAGPYTHTLTPLVASANPPVATIYTEDGSAIKRKFADMAIDQLTISGADKGPVAFDVSLLGSGKFTNGAMAGLPALGARTVLMSTDATILIGNPGGAAALGAGRVQSWTVTIKNNLQAYRGPGGGLLAMQHIIGQPQYSFDLTVMADAADDIMTRWENHTQTEVQINVNSGAAAQLNFKFANVYFSAAKLQKDGNNLITVTVSSDSASVLKVGANNPLQIVAINSVATYLN
jgi:hypothetical protein